jgi:hypothetical protein
MASYLGQRNTFIKWLCPWTSRENHRERGREEETLGFRGEVLKCMVLPCSTRHNMNREGDAAATNLAQDFVSAALLLLSKCIWTKQVL